MKQVFYIFFVGLLIVSCRKDTVKQASAGLQLQVKFNVDSSPVQFDTLCYRNVAKQTYSLSHLEFFISNIVLHSAEGDVVTDQVYYINARDISTTNILLNNLPARHYTGISCLIGLDSLHNQTGALYPSKENNGMYWPVQMGGGYHFMKLEGRVKSGDSSLGYAMHLGQNANVVHSNLSGNFQLYDDYTNVLILTMNVDSWFDTPYVYDFFVDGRYTMSYSALMQKLKANGIDVLNLLVP